MRCPNGASCLSKVSEELFNRNRFQSTGHVCLYFFFPHSKSKPWVIRYSSPLCFFQGLKHRVVFSLQTEAGSKVIPAKQPTPFKKKTQNKTRREGKKPPSFPKGNKKEDKSKPTPLCPRAGRRCLEPRVGCVGGNSPVTSSRCRQLDRPVLRSPGRSPGTGSLALAPCPAPLAAERPTVLSLNAAILWVLDVPSCQRCVFSFNC